MTIGIDIRMKELFLEYKKMGVYKRIDLKKLEEDRKGKLKLLHLIAGLIMLEMGIVILSGVV